MKTEAWAFWIALFVSVLTATGAFFLKLGASKSFFSLRQLSIDVRLLVGLGVYLLASLLYLTALGGGELSVLFPVISLEYLWASLLAAWRLQEKIGWRKGVGLAAIVCGVALIGWGSS